MSKVMIPFDVRGYREAINRAVREAYLELKGRMVGEQVYGYSVAMHPDGSNIRAYLQSEEGLDRVAQKYVDSGRYQVTKGDLFKTLRVDLRWNCADGWLLASEASFAEVNEIIDRSFNSYWEEFSRSGCGELVYLENMAALVENRAAGVFAEEPNLVLNLYLGDQSDEDLLSWAKQVNEFEVFARYRKELKERVRAYKRLVFVG